VEEEKECQFYIFGDKSVLRVKLQYTENIAEHSKTISMGKREKGKGEGMKATEGGPSMSTCVILATFPISTSTHYLALVFICTRSIAMAASPLWLLLTRWPYFPLIPCPSTLI
jgi:hypothetical protein